MVKNTIKLVEQAHTVIDVRYDIYFKNINDIYHASSNPFEMICNGFRFGYMPGMKAATAEAKKR